MGLSISYLVNKVINTKAVGSNELVYEGSTSWSNSAPINTAKTLFIDLPSSLSPNATYYVSITNPSTVSDVAVTFKNREIASDNTYFEPTVLTGTVLKNSPDGKLFIVEGWMLGSKAVIELKNATVLGASDGFFVTIRVRKA